jgi:hypothetical protein
MLFLPSQTQLPLLHAPPCFPLLLPLFHFKAEAEYQSFFFIPFLLSLLSLANFPRICDAFLPFAR